MLGENFVEQLARFEHFLRLNFNIADLATDATMRLVDHDFGIGQRESLAGVPPANSTAPPLAASPTQ